MNKKSVSAILALSLVVGAAALSGCGKEETAEKPTLKMLTTYSNEDLNTTKVAQLLEEKTGYKVQYDMLPQKNTYDKLNLILSGGDDYDIIAMGNNKTVFANYAKSSALTELDSLLDKYGSNLRSKISQESYNMLKVDGKQYGIPNTSGVAVSNSIVVRKDWLDKLGLKVPETVDDFTNMLKEFKEKDPGGNGQKNVPFVIPSTGAFSPNLQGAFGLATDWNDIDGKLVSNLERPEMVKYLGYMRSLYQKGYLDTEFVALNNTTAEEKFSSGTAGAMVLSCFKFNTIDDTLKKVCPDAEIVYLPLLKGEGGVSGIQSNATNLDKIVFVPKISKHPEDAVKWMDKKLDDDLFREFTIGEEGVHYEIKDGSYYPILPIFFDERNISSMYLTGIDEKKYPEYWQARIRKDERIYKGWDYLNHDSSYADNMKTPILADAPYIDGYDDVIQKLSSDNSDFVVKTIAGSGDIKQALSDYVNTWKANGGEKMTEAVNKWYAENKK